MTFQPAPLHDTPTASEQPQQIVTVANSYEAIASSRNVLRRVDAAWLFESAPDAMVLVNGQGRIVVVNPLVETMFGYQREELQGEPFEKLMPERFRDDYINHRSHRYAASRSRSMGADFELYGRRKDSSEFPIDISLSPLETAEGTLVSTAIRDLTDFKRTLEFQSSLEFEKLMSRLSKIFVNLPVDHIERELNNGLKDLGEMLDLDRVDIDLFDSDHKSRTVAYLWSRQGTPPPPPGKIINEAFLWTAKSIANRGICSVSGPEDLPDEAFSEREYMQSVGLKSWLAIPLLVGGDYLGTIEAGVFRERRIWDSLSISRFQQAGDLFACVLERRHAAESHSESEERFRTVANTAPVLIWMSGTDKLCTFFNQRWLAFTGRTMEEELGEGWASGVHADDLNRCLETYSAKFEARTEFIMEYRLRRHDGEYRWILDSGVPMVEAGGRFLGYIGSCIDITESKISERLLNDQLILDLVLAEISAQFINLPAKELDSQIKVAQRRICEALDLDRSTLFQVSADGGVITTHSWARMGSEPASTWSKEECPWTAGKLLGGQRVSFARIDDLPEQAATDKETYRRIGQKSQMAFPLSAEGKVMGVLAFGSLREDRKWPTPLVERVGLVAQVFANALVRAVSDERLRQAYGEIEQLKSRLEKENTYLRNEAKLEHHHNEVIGDSAGLRCVLKKGEQVAATDSTVLLLGETGTGKELIARTIHEHSRRKHRVMVKVNCATLPASLIESELFGREKGAFTGALTREVGRFELANGSTILLDEIAELPVELQSKLLRVLQEGEFERLGGPKTIKVDVRVIAATSRNLQDAVRQGKFREDLFYRLNVFPITIPPLRERREDIPALVWHFVNELGQRMGRSIETIHVSTMEAFKSYYWPGNVRELRNVIERFLITSTSTVFRADLPTAESGVGALTQTFETVERNHILHILDVVSWRVRGEGGAAQILGMKPTTLESRMQKLGIVRHK